jgi:cobalt-precorrin-5B (C1)-methyltransferase
MNNYEKNKDSKIDYGLTTGSLATATSLASLEKIIKPNQDIASVKIISPFDEFKVDIESSKLINKNKAESSAIKYPYNDPDVTVNVEIISTVELLNKEDLSHSDYDINDEKLDVIYDDERNINNDNIIIEGGIGVGSITKPGLQVPPNNSAINPGPLKMIKENLKPLIPNGKVAKVIISVPEGEEIAKKTMNPKLGIVGGISILGTTGIARAMSTKAYKDSLLCQLDITLAVISKGLYNKDSIVFVPGNIGEKFALKNLKDKNNNNIEKDQIVQMGNFAGFMLEEAKKRGIDKLTLFGHIGKLVKLAGGIFNTKHSVADGRREILAAHAGLCGADKKIIKSIFDSKTTEEIIAILKKENLDVEVLDTISLAIKERCLERFDIDLDVIIIDMKGNQLNQK